MLNKNKVKTYNGEMHLRELCRKIKGEYYLVGDPSIENSGHCYKINGTYYRVITDLIEYDHESKQYVLTNDTYLIKGVVDLVNGEELKFGYFQPNTKKNVLVKLTNGSTHQVLDESIFKVNYKFRERLSDGVYYQHNAIPASFFTTKSEVDSSYKTSLPYTCDTRIDEYSTYYKDNYNPELYPSVDLYGSLLGKYTFGVEFETINGFIPERICLKHGLIPVRDGSIKGLEYVTVPLGGKKGLNNLIDVSKELSKRTTADKHCSMHIHIGGMPRTQTFLLAFYKMVTVLQNEMFSMFPVYKYKNYGIKRKNYTKPLPTDILALLDNKITNRNVAENFEHLFEFLSMGQSFIENYNSINDVNSHPSDPNGTSKWNIKPRYYHVNMIPILFGNKKTIEFRIHTATSDYNKIINFLYMWVAIIKFCEDNESIILNDFKKVCKSTIYSIISSILPHELATSIYHYIDIRKKYISRCMTSGNVMADENNLVIKGIKGFIDWGSNVTSAHKQSKYAGLYHQMMGTAGITDINPFGNIEVNTEF